MTSPLVYRDLTQDELDRQYAPSAWTKHGQQSVLDHVERTRRVSDEVRRAWPHQLGIPYEGDAAPITTFRAGSGAPEPEHALDLYLPRDAASLADARGVIVYLHGGYWQLLDKASSSFGAEVHLRRGYAYVAIGYDLCPEQTLASLVEQVNRAVGLVLRSVTCPVFLVGHSAGAHLVATSLLAHPGRIAGACLVSGVYDLLPLRLARYENKDNILGLDTEEDARHVSPAARYPTAKGPLPSCPIIVAYGEKDSPEFHRQSLQFAGIYADVTHQPVTLACFEGDDHFGAIEQLITPTSRLNALLLDLIQSRDA